MRETIVGVFTGIFGPNVSHTGLVAVFGSAAVVAFAFQLFAIFDRTIDPKSRFIVTQRLRYSSNTFAALAITGMYGLYFYAFGRDTVVAAGMEWIKASNDSFSPFGWLVGFAPQLILVSPPIFILGTLYIYFRPSQFAGKIWKFQVKREYLLTSDVRCGIKNRPVEIAVEVSAAVGPYVVVRYAPEK